MPEAARLYRENIALKAQLDVLEARLKREEVAEEIDLSALLPDFGAGDRLTDFVQLTAEAGGTRIAVDPTGGLRGFTDVALIEGQALTDLSAEELGLAGGLPLGPVDALFVTAQRMLLS